MLVLIIYRVLSKLELGWTILTVLLYRNSELTLQIFFNLGLLVTVLVIEVIGRKLTIASEFLLTMVGFMLLFICSTK